ncbi:MAG TPA: hypothetical protein VHB18_12865 [Mycobacteriales bacterium]|jgi:hypothetical protein|nr:hypothetical protein [Mycobacteriales bacterium]
MRTLLATVAATAVATTLGGAGLALADTGAATSSVIPVVAHSKVDKRIDLGRKGFSVGDQETSSATLTSSGKAIGRLDGVCAATFATRSKAHELCSQTLALPGGEIVAVGTIVSTPHGPAPFDWAITGGTGNYAGATGFVHVIPANGPKIHMTIHVTY